MKQYIFFYHLDNVYNEYKVEATGMLDALVKAKKIKKHIEIDAVVTIDLEFKGVVYR